MIPSIGFFSFMFVGIPF
uniref:Uncharacterized protein n=1 Tax=Arundo donax TaxID=35708 RepID=A0A0A8Y799_ARUDO